MTSGGKRIGAGRKPRLTAHRRTILVEDSTIDTMRDIGNGTISRGIDMSAKLIPEMEALIRYAVENHRKFTVNDLGGAKNAWIERCRNLLLKF